LPEQAFVHDPLISWRALSARPAAAATPAAAAPPPAPVSSGIGVASRSGAGDGPLLVAPTPVMGVSGGNGVTGGNGINGSGMEALEAREGEPPLSSAPSEADGLAGRSGGGPSGGFGKGRWDSWLAGAEAEVEGPPLRQRVASSAQSLRALDPRFGSIQSLAASTHEHRLLGSRVEGPSLRSRSLRLVDAHTQCIPTTQQNFCL